MVQPHSQERIGNWFTLSTYFEDQAEWISQSEAARIRGVTRQAISRLIKKKRLYAFQIAGKTLLKRSEVEAFTPVRAGRPPSDRIDSKDQEPHKHS